MNIIFLDIDGVLNCELFFRDRLAKDEKLDATPRTREQYEAEQICPDRIQLLNGLCERTNAKVVVSSTWRLGRTIPELQAIFDRCGGTFTVIGTTGRERCSTRGWEIKEWIQRNSKDVMGIDSHKFYTYVIIDDDSDMLLNQARHFFHTDAYAGLTPNTCYRIERFFNSFNTQTP